MDPTESSKNFDNRANLPHDAPVPPPVVAADFASAEGTSESDAVSRLNNNDIVDAEVVSATNAVASPATDSTPTVDPTEVVEANVVHVIENAEIIDAQPQSESVVPPPIHIILGSDELASAESEQTAEANVTDEKQRSFVFRLFGWIGTFFRNLFGIASVIFLVAVGANIPIVQFMSFGYLLEVSGRLARGQKLRDAMVGLSKATVIGGIVLGTWLSLWPIRFVSEFWLEAFLIDPNSRPTRILRVVQVVSIALALLHISTAWMSGGKLRYFFWPFIAPVSFGIWLFKRTASSPFFKRILSFCLNWISPTLVDDICDTKPIRDWFPPAILWKRLKQGSLYVYARDRVWEFTTSLNLVYYLVLGFKGFIGTIAWLFIPTTLIVITSYSEGGVAILSGLFGTIFAIPIFAMLPFMQAHFAKDGKLKRFLEVRQVFKNFGRAPIAHFVALLMTLVLALPLFLLKIEQIPVELLWTLSLVFVFFSLPARLIVGLAYRRGAKKEQASRWWVRYPIASVMLPVSLAFVLILTLTRYISWYGALSLFENHVFLLPAPFWL